MTQLPHDSAAGSAEPPAPATLSIADILQALAFGARLSMQAGDAEPSGESSGSLPPPASIAQPSIGGATTGQGAHSTSVAPAANNPVAAPIAAAGSIMAQVGVTAGGGLDTLAAVGGATGGTAAGKAKAAAENGPCAECAARGCLPPPDETEPPANDDSTARWYIVTAGRRVGVFAHWANTAPLVVGVPGAVYVRCPTRAAAEAAFAAALEAKIVRVIE